MEDKEVKNFLMMGKRYEDKKFFKLYKLLSDNNFEGINSSIMKNISVTYLDKISSNNKRDVKFNFIKFVNTGFFDYTEWYIFFYVNIDIYYECIENINVIWYFTMILPLLKYKDILKNTVTENFLSMTFKIYEKSKNLLLKEKSIEAFKNEDEKYFLINEDDYDDFEQMNSIKKIYLTSFINYIDKIPVDSLLGQEICNLPDICNDFEELNQIISKIMIKNINSYKKVLNGIFLRKAKL